ncbi:unnamed protein product [Rotaria socialis]|uniref:Fucosyltransferase n=1 Tax=Rotaria socialis TaxID=392032 RepID=A0A818BHH9_9BILA|nr:unnamed protein product [Rotaria socialis]CAF3647014.1 unnamed protein product [Rotaria socialis]CAF4220278.1 unnamed protein product [Rotaria socialis]CAF4397774.1 unnamed protein product [Rotaria socialis]
MYSVKRPSNFQVLLVLIITSVFIFFYHNSIFKTSQPYIPQARLRPYRSAASIKVSISHYTANYGFRTDSRSNIFNKNLQQICDIYDPEEYEYADSVIVSLVDFFRFPTISNSKQLYRKKYLSQLWVLQVEESPRNSYRTAQIKSVEELDDWFNLTATLKPESDFHIQYRGYRIKPEIVNLIEEKLNIKFDHAINSTSLPQSNLFTNGLSNYLNILAFVLDRELNDRQDAYSKICPYTCNQPLPPDIVKSLQPHLNPIFPRIMNRDIVYIAWFVSNCDSHSGREEYVLKLRSQPGILVDIYGGCSSMFHSHIINMKCKKGISGCVEKTLPNYRFYLSFENSKCDTYITEKYWMHGLNGEAIPIVMGAKIEQYERIAVPNSYIHVDNYPTIEKLAEELHRLNRNDSEYVKYLQWKQFYDIGESYSPQARYNMHSTLCFLGHYQRLHAMQGHNDQRKYLLERIREIFNVEKIRLPNFIWETAKTKLIRISEFYNPKVNCWDNDFPSLPRRIYNYLFTWWKLF